MAVLTCTHNGLFQRRLLTISASPIWDWNTPQDSVGAKDEDSCEYNEGGKDRCMPQKRVGADDGDSCEYSKGGKD